MPSSCYFTMHAYMFLYEYDLSIQRYVKRSWEQPQYELGSPYGQLLYQWAIATICAGVYMDQYMEPTVT